MVRYKFGHKFLIKNIFLLIKIDHVRSSVTVLCKKQSSKTQTFVRVELLFSVMGYTLDSSRKLKKT